MRYMLFELKRDGAIPLKTPDVYTSHETMEQAMNEVYNKRDLLICKDIAIIPVITVYWDGTTSSLPHKPENK